MGLEELRKSRLELAAKAEHHLLEIDNIISESERVADVAHNSKQILDEIDARFEEVTGLNQTDIAFLLMATMLQTLRWVLIPELKTPNMKEQSPSIQKSERLGPNERNHIGGIYDGKKSGAEFERDALEKYREKHTDKVSDSKDEFYGRKNKFRSWIEILTQPVPYDAMNAMDKKFTPKIAGLNKQNPNGTYNNIYGKNHHVATLGHDPILGWIFGTANIMTNTVSFVDFQSFDVIQGHKIKSLGVFELSNELLFSDQAIDYSSPRNLISIFEECVMSTQEDYKRIAAAVVREAIHLASDKYCIEGLPIPIVPTINPEKAQELIEQGWNSLEFKELLKDDLKQIGVSAGLAVLINVIIESIYLLCLKLDDDIDIKRVKVKKIQSISEIISSSSNVLYVALTENIGKLDVGGIGVTMLTLLHSQEFIAKIKQEYIWSNYEALILGDNQKGE